jgi:hypothetical protein
MHELARAEREHAAATDLLLSTVGKASDSTWTAARTGRTWTRADELAHVLLALDFGLRAAQGTMHMRVQRPLWVSALSRAVLIPLLLRRGAFPAGGVSPDELDPHRMRRFSPDAASRPSALRAVQKLSNEAAAAFRDAAEHAPSRRVVHAYFGGLPLLTGWRLVSAHTRHHATMIAGDA